ncbi:hypothetical protein Ct61P_14065 [Colletotrichum tofieldiae]|nr:hypothetical protein Ct61P_14065 [Colletotrichum tofieldiae]
MLVSLTVGKVDAGVTVLLTPDKRLGGAPQESRDVYRLGISLAPMPIHLAHLLLSLTLHTDKAL